MAVMLSQTPLPSPEPELEAALGLAGLSSKTARFDETLLRFFRNGEFSTPLYSALSENPWRMPFVMGVKRREFTASAGKPSDSLVSGGLWAGWGTRRTLIGNPNATEEALAKKEAALNEVLTTMRKRNLLGDRVPNLDKVPKPVQAATALLLAVSLRARDYRALAIKDAGDPATIYKRFAASSEANGSVAGATENLGIYRRFHTNLMAAGAHDLTLACQTASAMVATVPAGEQFDATIDTAWGKIVLTGGSATTHPDEASLLVIDTGGSDTYLNRPSTSSHTNWCSIVIDTDSNDKYVSGIPLQTTPIGQFAGRKQATKPGPGGAVLGYSILFDLKGNDLYRSHGVGLGAGRLGFGVLYDAEGADIYDGYADSLGFGLFGGGILEDNGTGNDVYEGFNQVQGVGLMQGIGLLIDRGGNDQYRANDEVIDFPSPQSDKHNVSMSQGAGNGRRADYLEGNSLAGGIGVLYDLNGDDQYSSGVFGQGVGYWMGVGALWDGGGQDRYSGQWYVQAASAHFAIGYLEDEGGNDEYLAPMNMAQGAGHDFSVGVLIDRGGDDKHTAPNLSLGAGNANGVGWFADLGGNDSYTSSGWTLGKGSDAPADSMRARGLNLGVFMDLGGTDMYPPEADWAKNGGQTVNWTRRLPNPSESQLGVFWDR